MGCQLLLISDGYRGAVLWTQTLWMWLALDHDKHLEWLFYSVASKAEILVQL